MRQSATISPDATVSGGNILSMLAAMGPFRRRGETVLQEHGIGEVDVEAWYPLGEYVQALHEIGQRMGPNTLYQIGRQIVNHVALPPGIDSFERVLASFGQAFDLNHRGVAPGAISYRVTSDRMASITTATPYPCEFDRGVIHGFFQKLLGLRVTVEHADGACKNEGAPCCTHYVVVPVM